MAAVVATDFVGARRTTEKRAKKVVNRGGEETL